MICHSMKYQIIIKNKELYNIFNDLSYKTTKMCNKTIQLFYEDNNYKLDYKNINNIYPKDKEIYDCSLETYIYRKLRELYPEISSANTNRSIQFVKSKWNSNKKDILNLHKSIPSFKLGTPIQIDSKNYKLKVDNNKYFILTTLFSKQENNKFEFEIKIGDKTQKNIFYNILQEIYKQGSAQIKQEKNKWFLILSYSFENKTNIELDKEKIMGIDLGIINAVYWAINNSNKRGYIKGGEIDTFRKRTHTRRNSMLKIAGQTGHGRKRKIQSIEKLSNKIVDFRNTINHKYSRKIIDIALGNKCGTIQMEDLTNISSNDNFLKNWSYYDLQQKIIYKAKENGIEVKKINPEYTSQRCSKCGYVHEDNRKTQEEFNCISCGFKTNADYNAAKNIAIPNIEEIIKEQRKLQKIN